MKTTALVSKQEAMRNRPQRYPHGNWSSHGWAAKELRSLGYDVVTEASGWPDLLVKHPSGQLLAIEVKGLGDKLSVTQTHTINHLRSVLPVFVLRTSATKKDSSELYFDELMQHMKTFNRHPPEYFGA